MCKLRLHNLPGNNKTEVIISLSSAGLLKSQWQSEQVDYS